MKAKKILKKGYFWLEVVRMHYYFISNKKDFLKVLKHYNIDRDLTHTKGRCMTLDNNGQTIIIIASFVDDLSVLVHECVHAALFTFDYMGQDLSYNDELLPYLTDTIYTECVSKMK